MTIPAVSIRFIPKRRMSELAPRSPISTAAENMVFGMPLRKDRESGRFIAENILADRTEKKPMSREKATPSTKTKRRKPGRYSSPSFRVSFSSRCFVRKFTVSRLMNTIIRIRISESMM